MGWQTKKLGEICKVIPGQSPEGKYYNEVGIGLPFYQGKKEFSTKYIKNPKKWTTQVTKEAYRGDILMSIRAPVGAINFCTQHICIGRGLAALRPSNNLDPNFLFYYLTYKKNEIQGTAGAVFPSINKSQIENQKLPYIEILEQKHIVKILDRAFADIERIRANTEKNLKNTRELFESYLQQVFSQRGEGWISNKLSEVCTIKPPKKEVREKLIGDDLVSFVPMDCLGIRKKSLCLGQTKKLDDVVGSYTYFAENDVLLAKITPCFENGKLGIAKNLENGIGFGSSEYIVFRCHSKLIPDFLYYYLSRQKFRNFGKHFMTGAAGHKRIPKEFIANYKIRFPSISQQKSIVKTIDKLNEKIERLEQSYKIKVSSLNHLKKSLLQKAFTGQLTQQEVAA